MNGKSAQRLSQARLVLQAAEERQGLRSFERQSLSASMESIRSGVFETGQESAKVIAAMRVVLEDDKWMAATGISNVGWEAASRIGVDLRRIVRVVCPELQAATTLSTLLEGFEILVIGDVALSVPQQRILAARATMLERIILTTHHWPFISSQLPSVGVVQDARSWRVV